MDNTPLDVTVVIPALNAAETIGDALESLLSQNYPRERLHVVVVNNGSNDSTRTVAQRYGVEIVDVSKRGRAIARNRGISAAHSTIIFFLDADCRASSEWISTIVSIFKETSADAVQGYVIPEGTKPVGYEKFEHTHLGIPFLDTKGCAVRSDALKSFGIFDEQLLRCEDIDLAWKIIKGGGAIVFTDTCGVVSGLPKGLCTTIRRAYETAQGLHQVHALWRDRFNLTYQRIFKGFLGIARRESLRRSASAGLHLNARILYLVDRVATGIFYTALVMLPSLKIKRM